MGLVREFHAFCVKFTHGYLQLIRLFGKSAPDTPHKRHHA